MRLSFLAFLMTLTLLHFPAMAYEIGGAYAQLISCEWGQYGYEYGNLGTYRVNNQIIKQFFGNNYCPA